MRLSCEPVGPSGGLARNNPFRSSRVRGLRFRLDESAWRALLERWEVLGYRGALVGPKGTGKTTLLAELEARLEEEGWRLIRWRLREDRRRPTAEEWHRVQAGGRRDLVTVDGAEQLTWLRWRRLSWLSRPCGGLLITCHRPGMLPVLHQHQTSPELLADLVTELLGRRDLVHVDQVRDLFAEHHGNVRECLRYLYDEVSFRHPNKRGKNHASPDLSPDRPHIPRLSRPRVGP